MKSGDIVEEIKSRLDIVDIVSEHVDLKRAGQNYKGLCPFHSEKTPSFMVNPSKQIFHCFGCNKGGDMFTFIMDYENTTFPEAISYLSGKAGLKIEDFKTGFGTNRGLKETLYNINKEASDFFKGSLKNSGHALSYLKERGLTSDTIETFSIGYSRNDRDSLLNHLKKKDFRAEQIKASGLVYFGESASEGGAFDFFRDRIMFPISDLQGKVIAFGGRTMSSSKNTPKYINSPDSAVFKKGESCYGLNLAKNSITQKGYSIIVEGYLDAIMCHQHGFSNAIAPLGTALTAGHLKKLQRFSKKTLLLFDGDQAGVSAAKRSLGIISSEGMEAKVLILPRGEDPDTFLKKHGADHFRKYMAKAVLPVEFILKIYGKNKLDAVRHMLSLINSCPDSLQRDETLRELSSWSSIDELTLRQELKNLNKKSFVKKSAVGSDKNRGGAISREEETLLSIIFSMPEKSHFILDKMDTDSMADYALRELFEKMKSFAAGREDKNLSWEDLSGLCSSEEQKIATRLSVDSEIGGEHADEIIEGCLNTIALKGVERRIKQAGATGDLELLRSLLAEKKKLSHKKSIENF